MDTEKLESAEGEIKIDIHGLTPKVKIEVNSEEALILGVVSLINSYADLADCPAYVILANIVKFMKHTRHIATESREQAEVMHEIFKRMDNKND